MTTRGRIATTLSHQEPDRVPIGIDATPGMEAALARHLWVEDRQEIVRARGIDGLVMGCYDDGWRRWDCR